MLSPLPTTLNLLQPLHHLLKLPLISVRRELDSHLEGEGSVRGKEGEKGGEFGAGVGGRRVACDLRGEGRGGRQGGKEGKKKIRTEEGDRTREEASVPGTFGHEALYSTATLIPCSCANPFKVTNISSISLSVPVMETMTSLLRFFSAEAVERKDRIQER